MLAYLGEEERTINAIPGFLEVHFTGIQWKHGPANYWLLQQTKGKKTKTKPTPLQHRLTDHVLTSITTNHCRLLECLLSKNESKIIESYSLLSFVLRRFRSRFTSFLAELYSMLNTEKPQTLLC